MKTLQVLIDDIFLRVYQSAPSDDAELSRSHVKHLLCVVRDTISRDYLNLLIQNGKPIPSEYQVREVHDALAEDLEDTDESDERIYVTLDYQPMSLLNDQGVLRVLTADGAMVNKARNESIDWIKDLKYGKPTTKRPVYYRDSNKVILEGVSYKNPKPWTIYYIPTAVSQDLAESDTLVVSDELLDDLLTKVAGMCKEMMYGAEADKENNGSEDVQAK